MLIAMQKGRERTQAAKEVVSQTAIPLLGSTAIAVLAFGAIGLSDDSTGEYCRSLFEVLLISLSLSWITAVTITPLLPPPTVDTTASTSAHIGGTATQATQATQAAHRLAR
jgi:multidrug efflux pump subunit AcrB